MTFLNELKIADPGDNGSRPLPFFRHLRANWQDLFAEHRAERLALEVAPFVVISRRTDVRDAPSRPSTLRVTCRPHMDPSVGPFAARSVNGFAPDHGRRSDSLRAAPS